MIKHVWIFFFRCFSFGGEEHMFVCLFVSRCGFAGGVVEDEVFSLQCVTRQY